MESVTFDWYAGGHSFRCTVQKYGNHQGGDCEPDEKRLSPLCMVVMDSWLRDPQALVKSISERLGQSFEGEVAYGYSRDHPEEGLSPGFVTLFYLGDSVTVTEEFFHEFVREFCLAHVSAVWRAMDCGGTGGRASEASGEFASP